MSDESMRRVDVTEMEAFSKQLEDMVARVERLSVEQKVVGPKRTQEVDNLLEEARSFTRDFESWRRKQQQDERLAQALEAIGKTLEKRALDDGNDPVVDLDPKIIAEAQFLKAELAGLPTPALQPQFFKDGRRPNVPSGLEVLRSAINAPST